MTAAAAVVDKATGAVPIDPGDDVAEAAEAIRRAQAETGQDRATPRRPLIGSVSADVVARHLARHGFGRTLDTDSRNILLFWCHHA